MKQSFLAQEIAEQPSVWARVWEQKRDIHNLTKRIRTFCPQRIVLVARGSSDHAAIYGKYLIEMEIGLPVSLAAPSVITRYRKTLRFEQTLLIALSQSGEGEDVIFYVKEAAKNGALCLALTNNLAAALLKEKVYPLYMHAGKEKSTAATKTFTAELLSLLLLVKLWKKASLTPFANLPRKAERVLNKRKELEGIASKLFFAEDAVILGRGINTPTALEWALKLTEVCGLDARGMSAADFLHGPQRIKTKSLPYFLFLPTDPTYPFMIQVLKGIPRHTCTILSDKPNRSCAHTIKMPTAPTEATPLLYILPGQILSLLLAQKKKLNPDAPPYLQKVTKTL